MKLSEMRNMSDEELLKAYCDRKEEYFNLRMRKVTETLPNPLKIRVVRREIARILTFLRKRGYSKEKVKTWEQESVRK